MKLSKDTVALLKNFSTINGNLLLKPGNTIMTIAADKTVYACATVAETFPCEFGIYDLAEFLGSISMFEDADIKFNPTHAQIDAGAGSLRLFSANANVLTFPAKKLNFPAAEVEFSLTANQLQLVQRICSTIRANDIAIRGADGKLTLEASDKANTASNDFKLDLGKTDKEFVAYMKASNLKCLPYDYKVTLSKKAVRFQFNDIEYVFVLEADSVF
jgi:hypothetical protein